jgi:hypothetical protein
MGNLAFFRLSCEDLALKLQSITRLTLITAFRDGCILYNTSSVLSARISWNKAIPGRALVSLIWSITDAHSSRNGLRSHRYTLVALAHVVVVTGGRNESDEFSDPETASPLVIYVCALTIFRV